MDAEGLAHRMSQYLHVWEGAASLSLYPDWEFVLLLQLFRAASQVGA